MNMTYFKVCTARPKLSHFLWNREVYISIAS